jgi:plastocyanin
VKTASKLRLMGAAAALAALTVVAAGGAASASTAKQGAPVGKTIKMKGDSFKDLKFAGPDTISEGQTLGVVNLTKPKKVGPHTFTLVTKDALPKKDDYKKCEKLKPSTVCDDVVVEHEVEFPPAGPPIVHQPNVDNGFEGWDSSFDNGEAVGDSWYTETKDEETSRTVSAEVDKLFYFCLIHPNMKGKISVDHISR